MWQRLKWLKQPYLRVAGIETVGFQRMLKKTLETWQNEGKIPSGVKFIDLKPQGRHKDARIKSQITPVANGLWHIRPYMQPNKTKMNHMWELGRWPYAAERDLIDAGFGYCEDAWADPAAKQLVSENPHRKDWNKRRMAIDKQRLSKEI
jgi:hypothetical protein